MKRQISEHTKIENTASEVHETWSNWMKYLFSVSSIAPTTGAAIIPKKYVDHWKNQMLTAYADLSEKEKSSYRTIAIHLINTYKGEPQ